jgi:hypothetical protein
MCALAAVVVAEDLKVLLQQFDDRIANPMSATPQTELTQFKFGDRVVHKTDGSVGSVVQMDDVDIVRVMWDGAKESLPVFVTEVEPLSAVEPEPESEPAPEPPPAPTTVSATVPLCEVARTFKDIALPIVMLGVPVIRLQAKAYET